MGTDIHMYSERFTADRDVKGPRSKSVKRDEAIDELLGDFNVEPRWITADDWYVEDEDGEWYQETCVYSGRNYHLFSALGVTWRGNAEPLPIAERGVPEDASEAFLYAAEQMQGDAHTFSWMTLEEMMAIEDEEIKGYLSDAIDRMSKLDPDPKKVRACFFFDN